MRGTLYNVLSKVDKKNKDQQKTQKDNLIMD